MEQHFCHATARGRVEEQLQTSAELPRPRSWQVLTTAGNDLAPRELQSINPQLSANRAATGHSDNAYHHQLGIVCGGEGPAGFFPEISVSQLFAHEKRSFFISILDREHHASRAIHVAGFVEGGKFVACMRFDRDHLRNASVAYSRAIKCNSQRPSAGVRFAGVQCEQDSLGFLVYPIEAAIENVEAEISIDQQIL